MATPVFQGYQRVQLSDTEKAFYEDIAGINHTTIATPIISPSADAMGRVLNSFAAIAQQGRAQAQAMATPYLQRLTPRFFRCLGQRGVGLTLYRYSHLYGHFYGKPSLHGCQASWLC